MVHPSKRERRKILTNFSLGCELNTMTHLPQAEFPFTIALPAKRVIMELGVADEFTYRKLDSGA